MDAMRVSTEQSTQRQAAEPAERVADDLLIGAGAIAVELGMEVHAVYYAYRKKLLPIGKLGKSLVASRRKLRNAVQTLTS